VFSTSPAKARLSSTLTVVTDDLVNRVRTYRDVAHATNGWAVVSSAFLDAVLSEIDIRRDKDDVDVVATYGRT
jgi:hypothetical protein